MIGGSKRSPSIIIKLFQISNILYHNTFLCKHIKIALRATRLSATISGVVRPDVHSANRSADTVTARVWMHDIHQSGTSAVQASLKSENSFEKCTSGVKTCNSVKKLHVKSFGDYPYSTLAFVCHTYMCQLSR